MRLQHRGGEALYRESLQAATQRDVLFGFRKSGDLLAPAPRNWRKIPKRRFYGLHMPPPPQPVLVPLPPSALTAVGVTNVVRNRTAAPRASSTRFTSFLLLNCDVDRDGFMADPRRQQPGRTLICPEFVTK